MLINSLILQWGLLIPVGHNNNNDDGTDDRIHLDELVMGSYQNADAIAQPGRVDYDAKLLSFH